MYTKVIRYTEKQLLKKFEKQYINIAICPYSNAVKTGKIYELLSINNCEDSNHHLPEFYIKKGLQTKNY